MEVRMGLPRFSIDEYVHLLGALSDAGYRFQPVTGLRQKSLRRSLYLRHDTDLDPRSAIAMAQAEAELGVRSTYYVLLTQHYNPMQIDNRRAIRLLGELGHDIGLHYDMESFPPEPALARRHLDWQAAVLAEIAERPVHTICMHQPSLGQGDPFLMTDDYLHPHDPRYQGSFAYISDSCRGWRDDRLLRCCLPDGPRRVMLNTHPELWLDGSISDRMAYLDLLRDRVGAHYSVFIDTVVRETWQSHAHFHWGNDEVVRHRVDAPSYRS
jgi:hypothetical protein